MARGCALFPAVCIVQVCNHLNAVRQAMGIRRKVPNVAMNTFRGRLEPPTKDEGFTQVKVRLFVAMASALA